MLDESQAFLLSWFCEKWIYLKNVLLSGKNKSCESSKGLENHSVSLLNFNQMKCKLKNRIRHCSIIRKDRNRLLKLGKKSSEFPKF